MEAIKVEELHTLIGKVNSTSWFKVDQDRINAFANTLRCFSLKNGNELWIR